jgi:peptide-methionine (R)-S-oxide reductase
MRKNPNAGKPDSLSFAGSRRREWLAAAGGVAVAGALLIKLRLFGVGDASAADEVFEVTHSDAEWRALLTPEQYAVLRQEATERPFSSPLDHEKRAGTFTCAGCGLELFPADTKFDSGTGWPSFFRPLPHAVGQQHDYSLGIVHCRRCGGHLGHVFDDGPPPTGLRYCMNGAALAFRPA